jgi:hypothetical protein
VNERAPPTPESSKLEVSMERIIFPNFVFASDDL